MKNIILLDNNTNNYVITKTAWLRPRSKTNDQDKLFAFVFFPNFFAIVFRPANTWNEDVANVSVHISKTLETLKHG